MCWRRRNSERRFWSDRTRKISATLLRSSAKQTALRVITPQSLTPTVLQLLENYDERAALGHRAFEVMQSQRGATERTVSALLELLSAQGALSGAELTSERRA